MTSTNKQITGNIGIFYISYVLSLLDWNVLLTSRNSRGADLVISKNSIIHALQVKSVSKNNDFSLGINYNDPLIDFWVLLLNARGDRPKVFVVPAEDIINERDKPYETNDNTGLITFDVPKQPDTEPKNFWISCKYLNGPVGTSKYLNNFDQFNIYSSLQSKS
ncbi:MAG: hypothetical protein LBS60_08145 [Deltaproteobacteria bacterium]|jgi:hypothetical protein|nr:hypothetical protein [Deltaproteobacteria bacterium]